MNARSEATRQDVKYPGDELFSTSLPGLRYRDLPRWCGGERLLLFWHP